MIGVPFKTKESPMDQKVIDAIIASREHWKEMAQRDPQFANLGPKGCALCRLFFASGCAGCPLAKVSRCPESDSVYIKATRARFNVNQYGAPVSDWQTAAEDMVKTLDSLLPKSHRDAPKHKFPIGTRVRYYRGAYSWHGIVVGQFSSSAISRGYVVESEREFGALKIFEEPSLVELKE